MVVLIDTNVAINYLTNRPDENTTASVHLMTLCGERRLEGFIANYSVPVIWYVLRNYPENDRRTMLRNLCTVLSVSGVSQEAVFQALDREDFTDFEDCLQDQCAQEIGADYIITCNVKDFKASVVPALTPTDFLKHMK